MSRTITPDLTVDHVKKEAKRWLKEIRANDASALARFARALPNAPPAQNLRAVQLALAREFGLDGWRTLKAKLADRATASVISDRPLDELVSLFLDNACPDHHVRGGSDHVRAEHTAMRLLDRHPEIATANFYTAVVCGDLDTVIRALAADPGWATRPNGEATPERIDVGWRRRSCQEGLGTERLGAALVTCASRGCRCRRSRRTLSRSRARSSTMARIPTSISWLAPARTRRSSVQSAKAKRAGRRISSETRSCGSCSSGAPTRTTHRSSTTSISMARPCGSSS